jgi:hypothetical protein
MAAPENASMRKSTKRVVADEDLVPLAEMTIGLGARVPFSQREKVAAERPDEGLGR